MKFPSSFQSLPFDWQLGNEIPKFEVNLASSKRTSQTTCQKFCEIHCKDFLQFGKNLMWQSQQKTFMLFKYFVF